MPSQGRSAGERNNALLLVVNGGGKMPVLVFQRKKLPHILVGEDSCQVSLVSRGTKSAIIGTKEMP